jgi:hypothetical protein
MPLGADARCSRPFFSLLPDLQGRAINGKIAATGGGVQ